MMESQNIDTLRRILGISKIKDKRDQNLFSSGRMRALFLKRPFDVALSFFGLILSLPLWFIICFFIWVEDRGPILYSQNRVGKNGKIFKAYKFRSMIKEAEQRTGPIQAKENDPRMTKAGKILRAMALDELPQLINILKGEMSFVGPRALRPEEIEVKNKQGKQSINEIPHFEERHSVTPGLTGLTQIYLPKDSPRRKKFCYDLLYIKKQSFWLDLKLILISFWITFRAKWETRKSKL